MGSNFLTQKGLSAINWQWYYLDEATGALWTNGWKQISNGWIYGQENGVIPAGLSEIEGTWRYIDPNTGVLKLGLFQTSDGNYSYAPDGIIHTGLQDYGTGKVYIDPTTKLLVKNAFVQQNGKTYYMGSDFLTKKGLSAINWQWYYLDETTGELWTNGWKQISNGWIYGQANGIIPSGLNEIEGTWRYIDPNTGVLKLGLFQTSDGKYTYAPGGIIYSGFFVLSDGNTLYIDPNTHVCHLGWLNYNNNTFYFLQNGLGAKYENFLKSAVNDSFYWFYFEPAWGSLVKNQYVTIGNKSYWADGSGILQSYVPSGNYGIDVSAFQGNIDWTSVRNGGIKFAIIRVMGANNSGYYIDPYFRTNMNGALAAGIQVGAYLYSYAFNENEMMQEINFVLPTLAQYKDKFTYPIYIDYEDKLIWNNTTSNAQRTNILRTGMDALNGAGYLSGFYTYYSAAKTYIDTQTLLDEGYDFWVAHTSAQSLPWKGASIWQYSHTGQVAGISGNTDLNISYVDYASLNRYVTVYDQNTGKNVTGRLRDIVAQIVQNEVGSGIGLTGMDAEKLYMAQALATHSWLEYQWSYYGASYIPSVGLKTPSTSVTGATNRVIRLTVQYNGSVANTAYTASAGAYTNSSANMGWGYQPYLISVKSEYDKEFDTGYYVSGSKKSCFPWTWTTTEAQMSNSIYKMTGYRPSGAASGWITVTTDVNHNVTSVRVNTTAGQIAVSPDKFLADCLGIISMNVTKFEYNSTAKAWTIESYGHGHGVGMSQCGAAGYIAHGASWRDVLAHYYPGTTIA